MPGYQTGIIATIQQVKQETEQTFSPIGCTLQQILICNGSSMVLLLMHSSSLILPIMYCLVKVTDNTIQDILCFKAARSCVH